LRRPLLSQFYLQLAAAPGSVKGLHLLRLLLASLNLQHLGASLLINAVNHTPLAQ
jgi:hypothetical protein